MTLRAERVAEASERELLLARHVMIGSTAVGALVPLLLAAALIYGMPDGVRAIAILGASLAGTLFLAIAGLAWLARRAAPVLTRTSAPATTAPAPEDAASIAHDLRAPLATVNTYLDLLVQEQFGPMPAAAREAAGRAALASARLEAMVEATLLHHARAEAVHPIERCVIDLNDVLADVLTSLSARIEAQNAEISVGPLPTVRGDASRVFRIFENLVDNAVKYHAPGQPPRVTVTGSVVRDRGEIVVRDYGIGLPPEECEQVFDRTWRGSNGIARAGGSGLGLANVRRLVEELDGEACIDATVTPGLAVRVTLPAA